MVIQKNLKEITVQRNKAMKIQMVLAHSLYKFKTKEEIGFLISRNM